MRKAVALVLAFLALSSVTLAGTGLVGAVEEVDTAISISVPAALEVAQTVNVKIWIEPAPPSSTDRFHNLTLTITRPDGVKNDLNPMKTEDGSYFWSYMINQLGNYTFQCTYAGEYFADGAIRYKPSQSPTVVLTGVGDSAPPVEVPGGSWVQKQSMSQARGGLGVAAVNGKIYAIGGHVPKDNYYTPNPTSGFVGTNEEYDPATDTWTLKASMPTLRSNFAIAACNNKIYCINSAIVGFKLDDIYHMFQVPIWSGINEAYDPATDTWETKAPMPTAMSNAKANVVNGKIYIFDGGVNWVYNPASDSWATRTPAPISVGGYPSAVAGDKIYFMGNYEAVQIYDTETDNWSQGARSPRLDPKGVAAATTGMFAPERIYLFTVAPYGWVPYGKTDTSVPARRTTFVYNPQTDSWSAGAVIPNFRLDFTLTILNDKIFAIGGYAFDNFLASNNVTACAKNEQYTPIGYGEVNPKIDVISPQAQSYVQNNVALTFTVDKQTVWLGYILDGEEKIPITGNTTLADLPNGFHNITVYAKDAFDHLGESETIRFNIAKEAEGLSNNQTSEPFPTAAVAAISGASTAVACLGVLFYIKKRKH